ncbi:MAG: SDR family NAD(P)-dependent oxidoreductase [Hyphomicrobiales bacterium]|nr:SDR family NAD(P)-dependent oxidoreductase [Hyphomicrobiales bacterium]
MRVIVITGGTRGLGAALTRHYATNGHNVVMNYRNAEAAARVGEEIASTGAPGRLLPIKADVRNREEIRGMFGAAVAEFSGIDVLINCAGVNRDTPFLELTDEDWDTVVDTHLKGTFICSQEYVRHNADKPGNIVNLGAACGIQGRLNGANFCSAKGGILALTKCMARELAPRIRVNCLTPSAVDTEEVRERYALDTPEGLRNVLSGIPMGRLGAHADVLHMVDCILGAEFTTGENFFVNGGEFMQ